VYKFNSCLKAIPSIFDCNNQDLIKNEGMLFSYDALTLYEQGINNVVFQQRFKLTWHFLRQLMNIPGWDWTKDVPVILDSRVHMLMPNFYPAIPGYHLDDVPRELESGQPNHNNPSYKAEHCMLIAGDASKTDFALGEITLPEIKAEEKYYKVWHPLVDKAVKDGKMTHVSAEPGNLYFFDWQTFHQGTKATKNGWRWFIRASKNTTRPRKNEIRQQVQVYLENPMEGW